MTYEIGGHMNPFPYTEDDLWQIQTADTLREKAQAAYDLLYPTDALTKGTKYFEGYAAALRDMLEELV